MNGMRVIIDRDDAVEMLMDRLNTWTDDPIAEDLYREMYTNYIEGGVFDDGEFSPSLIVDNDWVNYCDIVEEGGDWYEKAMEAYKDGDYEFDNHSIEATYEKGNGDMVFLIRYNG